MSSKVWDCWYVASPSFQWYFPAHLLDIVVYWKVPIYWYYSSFQWYFPMVHTLTIVNLGIISVFRAPSYALAILSCP